jgi:hypothetical protein
MRAELEEEKQIYAEHYAAWEASEKKKLVAAQKILDAQERRRESLRDLIDRTWDEAATADMCAADIAQYKAAILGASLAERTFIYYLTEAAEARKKAADATKTYRDKLQELQDAIAIKTATAAGDEKAVRAAEIKQLMDATGMTEKQAAAIVDLRKEEERLTEAIRAQKATKYFESFEAMYSRIAESAAARKPGGAVPGPTGPGTTAAGRPGGGGAGPAGGGGAGPAGGGGGDRTGERIAAAVEKLLGLALEIKRGLPLAGVWAP